MDFGGRQQPGFATSPTAQEGAAPSTRALNTTAPLTGGGDLSADRTLAISAATSSTAGSLAAADKAKIDLVATSPQSLSGAGAVDVVTDLTLLTTTGAGQALTMADGTKTGQNKLVRANSGYDGTNTSVITPANGPAVTLANAGEWVWYRWNGAAWQVVALRKFQTRYPAVGNNGAGHVTATGAKVGDRVVAAWGYITATGAVVGLDTTHFERVVTVADQIQQSGSDLSANSYLFTVEPQS